MQDAGRMSDDFDDLWVTLWLPELHIESSRLSMLSMLLILSYHLCQIFVPFCPIDSDSTCYVSRSSDRVHWVLAVVAPAAACSKTSWSLTDLRLKNPQKLTDCAQSISYIWAWRNPFIPHYFPTALQKLDNMTSVHTGNALSTHHDNTRVFGVSWDTNVALKQQKVMVNLYGTLLSLQVLTDRKP